MNTTNNEATQLKRVQEVALNGEEPPLNYLSKDKPTTEASSSSSIPIIDLHLLLSSTSTKEKEDEIDKLRSSLASWGFFQAVGHGIPSILLDKILSTMKEFFHLPMEEKQKYSRVGEDGTMEGLEGYGNDTVKSEQHILDWCDRLYLLVKPQERRTLKMWPESPKHFRETLHEYSVKASLVADNIIKVMAQSVGLEENSFLSQFGKSAPMYARMNYYPPCSRPDLVDGIKPHTDGGGITILLQDKEVEGLQVFKDGEWIKVPIVPHALVVNIADQMEIMSNGMFMSPMHRAVTNSEKARISLALFYVPDLNNEIGPAVGLIDDTRPRLFRNIKGKDYVEFFTKNFLQGKRAIDWARV
ncbi:hypothetical protein AQUCO_02800107v1 [Aquilegia coerulea]|uniref:Fe2OG dioxygenase domain-containing protein n=1 Tax=Aquilegia coerulea TaxID=218851 RepID=A0A2G5D3W3_AQUCA|nr:hypothetical protein AQUCO_02800107v1 [Aquilegia coerulea]